MKMAYQINLTEDDVFKISLAKPEDALDILRDKIEIECKTVSDLLRNRILLDCLLDNIKFCVLKGFSLKECIIFTLLFNDLILYLKKYVEAGLDDLLIYVTEGLKILNGRVDKMKLKKVLDYLNDTIFIHYDLYKYVFTQERDALETNEKKKVSCPDSKNDDEHNFKNAKPYYLWDYENKMKVIEKKEKENDNKFLDKRLKFAMEEEALKKIQSYVRLDENDANLNDEESLSKLIDSIANPILNITSSVIKNEAEEVKENILINIEKILLPRPEECGPLPAIVPKSYKPTETLNKQIPQKNFEKKEIDVKRGKSGEKKSAKK